WCPGWTYGRTRSQCWLSCSRAPTLSATAWGRCCCLCYPSPHHHEAKLLLSQRLLRHGSRKLERKRTALLLLLRPAGTAGTRALAATTAVGQALPPLPSYRPGGTCSSRSQPS
ncbi:unnamed protein product, partial [Ectocarpus sp. 12 AP-2014]